MRAEEWGNEWNRIDLRTPITFSFYHGSVPTLTLEEMTDKIYGQEDVVVSLKSNIPAGYPEIASVVCEGYQMQDGTEIHKKITYTWDKENQKIIIPHDKIENSGKDIYVRVKVTDTDGHVNSADTHNAFSMNSTAPDVGITMTDETNPNADDGYYLHRKAHIIIKDAEYTRKSYDEIISSLNITRNEIPLSYEEKALLITKSSDENQYELILDFRQDGKYHWDFHYINLAGMYDETVTENGKSVHDFTIDTIDPTGTITVSGNKWYEKLYSFLTSGWNWHYDNEEFSVSIRADDLNLKEDKKIEYYISSEIDSETEPLKQEELEAIPDENWLNYTDNIKMINPEKYVIYARITDKAGNRVYLSSDGFVIDTEKLTIDLTDENGILINTEKIYNENIIVRAKVWENEHAILSGLNHITYWVTADGRETQRAVLYQTENSAPDYGEGLYEWDSAIENSNIEIDSQLNNSSNVVLYVEAVDNAGNITLEELPLHIDIDEPEIQVSYQDNADNQGNGYFKSRTATISITEREGFFDSEKASSGIKINDVSRFDRTWTSRKAETPGDMIYTTTVTFGTEAEFSDDGEYQLEVSYTDKAGNQSEIYTDSFIIDNTAPKGSITVQPKDSIWEKAKRMIFGSEFSGNQLEVSIEASDNNISEPENIKIEYYISENKVPEGQH